LVVKGLVSSFSLYVAQPGIAPPRISTFRLLSFRPGNCCCFCRSGCAPKALRWKVLLTGADGDTANAKGDIRFIASSDKRRNILTVDCERVGGGGQRKLV